MKRPLAAAAIAAAAIAIPTAHAAADKPAQFIDQRTITDINPCTGEVGDVELTFDVTAHQHPNNTVLTIKTSSSGADGWSGGGSDTLVINAGGQIETANLRITSPDDQRFFVVKYVLKFGPNGEPEITRNTFDCRP